LAVRAPEHSEKFEYAKEICMNRKWISMLSGPALLAGSGVWAVLLCSAPRTIAQGPPTTQPQGQPEAPPKPGPVTLQISDGTTASYRVQEQLAGVNFPSEAVGTSNAVTGMLYLNADGSIDSSKSKLEFDLRTLKSDQDMRDGFIQKRTLETEKFPTAVFVPKTVQGLTFPLPARGQTGFQMTGEMTIHGVTAPVTWSGIATFNHDIVAGRTMTSLTFAQFGMTKPALARLLSVDDKIELEVAFKFKRS
jgi:polyisoprenoid-binding protein YceI